MQSVKSKVHKKAARHAARRITWRKILEVAFWGTVIWGTIRMTANYLGFTPYGVRSFSRPLLGMGGEGSAWGAVSGLAFLFLLAWGATALYAVWLSRIRLWWGGLIYGLVWLLVFGFFFRMANWEESTLSTELGWFLSFGLFIGMTFVAERAESE
ncbi:hypothetical protein G3578_05980 [Brevibacillus sp. SYP-B805]|uniref:YqhR family membrane protein n=1 Tax=Brevibacillus sp. SYP-B805 TaxID=1578199 RepID=UPI0013EC19FC|nr:YqhR family membrane protein [Brevibacillus sp. SYP-B805]NGQ94731.1 hypothetical protein [Brevibacillus sp. SYP-B805]